MRCLSVTSKLIVSYWLDSHSLTRLHAFSWENDRFKHVSLCPVAEKVSGISKEDDGGFVVAASKVVYVWTAATDKKYSYVLEAEVYGHSKQARAQS